MSDNPPANPGDKHPERKPTPPPSAGSSPPPDQTPPPPDQTSLPPPVDPYTSPPTYGPPAGPPTYGPPPAGPPTYGPPAHSFPPGYHLPPSPGAPALPPTGMPNYLPPNFYAGPSDPLVSADFGGWWARSFRLFQAAWQPMALVTLISAVPMFFVTLAASLQTRDALATVDPATTDLGTLFAPLIAIAPFYLVAALLGPFTQLTCLRLLVQVATGRPISIRAALSAGLRRTLPLIGWSLLGGLLAVVGLALCLVPGFYVLAVISILAPIVLLERGKGVGRAFELVHSNVGAALGRIAVTLGLTVGIAVFVFILTGAITPTGNENVVLVVLAELITAAGTLIGSILTIPLTLTTYADMRARREPFSTAYLADVR